MSVGEAESFEVEQEPEHAGTGGEQDNKNNERHEGGGSFRRGEGIFGQGCWRDVFEVVVGFFSERINPFHRGHFERDINAEELPVDGQKSAAVRWAWECVKVSGLKQADLFFSDAGRLRRLFDGQTSGGARFAQAETCFL